MNRIDEIDLRIKALTDEREQLLEEHKVKVARAIAALQKWVGVYFKMDDDSYCLGIRVLEPKVSWEDPRLEFIEMGWDLSYGYIIRSETPETLKKYGCRSKKARSVFLKRWSEYSNFINVNIEQTEGIHV